MKKYVLVLATFATFLFCSPAHAGVPCSVPFNLTNGTIADASQVMANYNAILSCLATSTAASGSNNDITALNALSTPITAAQGGAQALCGASGYKVVNNGGTPNTALDISFSEAIVTNPLGSVQRATNGFVTLSLGTIGAINGLDAGSQTANTIYYIWLIGNGTVVNSLASLSSTAPTLPTGYTYKCRLSAAVTDNTNLLLKISTLGERTRTTTADWASTTLTGFLSVTSTTGPNCGTVITQALTGLPLTAVAALGMLRIGAATNALIMSGPAATAAVVAGATQTTSNSIQAYFETPLYTAQTIYYCSNDTGNFIKITGWVDSANAH